MHCIRIQRHRARERECRTYVCRHVCEFVYVSIRVHRRYNVNKLRHASRLPHRRDGCLLIFRTTYFNTTKNERTRLHGASFASSHEVTRTPKVYANRSGPTHTVTHRSFLGWGEADGCWSRRGYCCTCLRVLRAAYVAPHGNNNLNYTEDTTHRPTKQCTHKIRERVSNLNERAHFNARPQSSVFKSAFWIYVFCFCCCCCVCLSRGARSSNINIKAKRMQPFGERLN